MKRSGGLKGSEMYSGKIGKRHAVASPIVKCSAFMCLPLFTSVISRPLCLSLMSVGDSFKA